MTSQIGNEQIRLQLPLSPDMASDIIGRFKTACIHDNEQEIAAIVTQVPNIIAEAGPGRSSLYYCYALQNRNLKLFEKLLWFGFPILNEEGKLDSDVHKMILFDIKRLGVWDIELLDLLVGFGWDPWKSLGPDDARAMRKAAKSNQIFAEWFRRNQPPEGYIENYEKAPVRKVPALFREQLHDGRM